MTSIIPWTLYATYCTSPPSAGLSADEGWTSAYCISERVNTCLYLRARAPSYMGAMHAAISGRIHANLSASSADFSHRHDLSAACNAPICELSSVLHFFALTHCKICVIRVTVPSFSCLYSLSGLFGVPLLPTQAGSCSEGCIHDARFSHSR